MKDYRKVKKMTRSEELKGTEGMFYYFEEQGAPGMNILFLLCLHDEIEQRFNHIIFWFSQKVSHFFSFVYVLLLTIILKYAVCFLYCVELS